MTCADTESAVRKIFYTQRCANGSTENHVGPSARRWCDHAQTVEKSRYFSAGEFVDRHTSADPLATRTALHANPVRSRVKCAPDFATSVRPARPLFGKALRQNHESTQLGAPNACRPKLNFRTACAAVAQDCAGATDPLAASNAARVGYFSSAPSRSLVPLKRPRQSPILCLRS